jgi:hypothetical protein
MRNEENGRIKRRIMQAMGRWVGCGTVGYFQLLYAKHRRFTFSSYEMLYGEMTVT